MSFHFPAPDLVSVLELHAEARPEALAFAFLDAQESEISYGALARSARRIGALLQAQVGVGERALLLYAPGLAFIEAFLGCLYAGVVAVPVYPPEPTRLDRTLPRLQAIARDARAKAVLTSADLFPLVQPLGELAPEFSRALWVVTDDGAGDEAAWRRALYPNEALAYLQYTSGSTGTPKGVMISHGNLMHNLAQIKAGFGHDAPAVGVGWLPTYHDMGLVGKVLQTLYLGTHSALMSPLTFLKRPVRWLEAITRFRGTTSGGPNFAYDLCTRKVTEEELARLDLSSWRVAFCGAEPVRFGTLDRFARRFEACGFQRAAFFPCYGLAEATLYVTGGWLGSSARALSADPSALAQGRLEDAQPDADGATLVGCGPSALGQDLRIVHPETRRAAGAGEVGEVWVQGPHVALGYWDNEEATQETFRARLADEPEAGEFLRTGDLGVLRDGQLLVTGRRKDLIILHGRNHYPQDIEQSVEASHPWVREGCTAAVAIPLGAAERLAVIAEVNVPEGGDLEQVVDAIRAQVAERHEVAVQRVALVGRGALPKTSSGKVQRRPTAQALLDGSLDALLVWEAGLDDDAKMYDLTSEKFQRLEGRNTRYRFDIEQDVLWDQSDAPGAYFTRETLEFGGIDVNLLKRDPKLWDTFQWALAVGICEEFVQLESRILAFMEEELAQGRLEPSRSSDLFQEEEVKHVELFRRYGEVLRAQRPALAEALDRHLKGSFAQAWWANDRAANYPSAAAYHYVTWLHFLFFEEYSIYLHDAMLRDEDIQPAWMTVHAAHRREEQQHVVTDQGYVEALRLSQEERERWSLDFLERCGADASGLAGLEGVWGFCVEVFPRLAATAQPRNKLDTALDRQRSFAKLLKHRRAFARTCGAAPAFDAFVAKVEHTAARQAAPVEAVSDAQLEARVADWLAGALAGRLGLEPSKLDRRKPFPYFGMDSIAVVGLAADLEVWTEATFGRKLELSPSLLFEHYTVELLSRKLATLLDGGAPAAPAAPSPAESLELDPTIFEDEDAPSLERAFVTGATGFLMGYVLAELLRRPGVVAHVLVRAADAQAGLARVRDNLVRTKVWEASFEGRIIPVLGDLSKPLLGMDSAQFQALAGQVDSIYHGGAVVDFIQPYELLKEANVQGTQEIIRLAHKARARALNFVSTVAVFDTLEQRGLAKAMEDAMPDGRSGFRNGYAHSKWAAEGLVRKAAERGLPVRIFRPGIVSGHSRTGHWQLDLVAAMLKGFASMGAAIEPVAGGTLNAAPVDYVAAAVVQVSQQPHTLGQTFHLTNPTPTPWSDIYTWMNRFGYQIEAVPYPIWMQRLQEAAQRDPAVKAHAPYFTARPEAWQLRQPPFDVSRAQAALRGTRVSCPALTEAQLGVYLRHFIETGFMAPPQRLAPGAQRAAAAHEGRA